MMGVGPFVLAVIGGLMISLGAPLVLLVIGLIGVGFVFRAKWGSVSKGKFVTFGPKEMNSVEKRNYLIGYVLLGVSALASSVILLVR